MLCPVQKLLIWKPENLLVKHSLVPEAESISQPIWSVQRRKYDFHISVFVLVFVFILLAIDIVYKNPNHYHISGISQEQLAKSQFKIRSNSGQLACEKNIFHMHAIKKIEEKNSI